jgi:16S rRNA (uracil1498-N3)-methyltransferase
VQRYFVHADRMTDTLVTIVGDDVKHISRVMRMEPGDKLICCDGESRTPLCEIKEITNESIKAHIVEWVEEDKELPLLITIAQGLPKGDKLEWIVQKGTEFGASAFMPFTADRSIVKWDAKKSAKKTERLQKIAKEAAEQSHRSKIPDCSSLVSFNELLRKSKNYNFKVIAYEEAAKEDEQSNFSTILEQANPNQSMIVVIGPEGGLTEEEVSLLLENGFISCGLGPRILRTESASLYLLAAVSYHFELLR